MAVDKERKASAKAWPGFSEVEAAQQQEPEAASTVDQRTIPVHSGLEICVLEGDDAGKVFPLQTAEVVLGRRMFPEENKVGWILFNEHTVSRMHAVLQWRQGSRRYRLVHRSTTNPTFVNGRITEDTVLHPDDAVRIGDLTFQIRTTRPRTPSEMEHAEDPGAIYSGFKIAVTAGPDQGHQFILDHKVIHIGGAEARSVAKGNNWIVIDDPRLPREQAFLVWYETDQRYGIFHAGESAIPTQISRVAHAPAAESSGDVRNLLQTDDMVLLGDTTLLVLRHERFVETGKALQHSPSLDDSALRKQPKKVSHGPHPPRAVHRPKESYDQKNREIVNVAQKVAERDGEQRARPSVQVKGSAGLIHAEGQHDATLVWFTRADYVLEFLEGPDRGRRVMFLKEGLKNDRVITIGGPGRRSNDIGLEAGVANQQAKLHFQDGLFTFINEGGGEVYVNDTPSHVDVLKNGDEIRVGPNLMVFIDALALQRQCRFELELIDKRGEQRRFHLDRDSMSIGRGKKVDVHVDDPAVSREQARLSFRHGGFVLQHKGETNPTFVNGVSLSPGKEKLLQDGDEIQISDRTSFVFHRTSV